MECACDISSRKLPEIVDVDEDLNNELKTYFKREIDGYVQVGPKKWFYPVKYRKLAQDYLNFEVRPDDVWITGVPRSGTTVSQELAWLLRNNLDFEEAKKDISERVQFFEANMVLNEKVAQEVIRNYPDKAGFIQSLNDLLKTLSDTKQSRVIKTHLPLELLPPDLLEKGCKVIYVCRHPKDVAVSYFFLQKSNWHINYQGDFPKFWSFFQNGNCMFGPYFEHVKQALEKKGHKNFLFIFYEDLRKDLKGYIKKVSEFLGRPVTESELLKLENHLDFENFQKNPSLQNLNDSSKKKFLRKGKVGGWTEHFTEEMNKKADEWIELNTKKIGFTYPSHE